MLERMLDGRVEAVLENDRMQAAWRPLGACILSFFPDIFPVKTASTCILDDLQVLSSTYSRPNCQLGVLGCSNASR